METPEQALLRALRPAERKSSDEVTYQAFQADDPQHQRILDDGSTVPDGLKLGLLYVLFKGDTGDVPGPHNTLYPISLKPWSNADPDTTFLRIEVPALKAQKFPKRPPLTPEEISDYELTIEVRQPEDATSLLYFIPSGRLITIGTSLARWRKIFGGDEGYIENMAGEKHFVSLKPWPSADPEHTFIRFNWVRRSQYPLPH